MKERWQKILALALAAALTLLGGVQVFADGEQAPLTVGQSGPQPVLLTAASAETANEFTTADGLKYSITDAEQKNRFGVRLHRRGNRACHPCGGDA